MTIPIRPLLAACIFPLWAQAGVPTFYKDVQPILERHCESCHRVGEVAPMPLTTYAETRPWAKAIRQAVLERKMPPWFADPHYGKFSNDLSLDAADIAVLSSWAETGAHKGTPVQRPTPNTFAEGWMIAKPDVVFEMLQDFHVPATGVVDYQFFKVPTGFTEDRWVEQIEVRPGNRGVVHHGIVYVQSPGFRNGGAQYLGGYAPGAVPQIWEPGKGRLIRAGSTLIFQMHYTPNGKEADDRTQLGLVFAKQKPEQQVLAVQALNSQFVIPPGDPDFQVDAVKVLPMESYLVGLRAHMHLRGKSFEFRVAYPDGRTEVLLRIPKYDFHWQPYYYLQTPLKLPRGTRIECTAHFDNSPNNEFNPDPKRAVPWGEQSWDEMMVGWFDIAIPVKEEHAGTTGYNGIH